jgi:hypothetical protein
LATLGFSSSSTGASSVLASASSSSEESDDRSAASIEPLAAAAERTVRRAACITPLLPRVAGGHLTAGCTLARQARTREEVILRLRQTPTREFRKTRITRLSLQEMLVKAWRANTPS